MAVSHLWLPHSLLCPVIVFLSSQHLWKGWGGEGPTVLMIKLRLGEGEGLAWDGTAQAVHTEAYVWMWGRWA